MNFHVIIPARLKSTRLPNKPLADIHGLPMIVRVARQSSLSQAHSVTVAADDELIVQACEQHGIHAILTQINHPSGSDRLAQASEILGLAANDIVVNVQGDEPLIPPELIDDCAATLNKNSECVMSTAAHTITDNTEYANPNVVKVVCNAAGHAMYFSRAPIPWWRDGNLNLAPGQAPKIAPTSRASALSAKNTYAFPLRHIGIYAYRVNFLQHFPTLSEAPLEKIESLEQLRVLWHGHSIAVHVTPYRPGPGVDTQADLEHVRTLLKQQ